MNKWTRRGLLTVGVIGGTALVVGVAIRPGNRVPELRGLVEGRSETLINAWVKLDEHNIATVIVPHAEMGQGARSVLAQMLADEMDLDWHQVRIEEAPAHEEYANYILGKGFILGGTKIPTILAGTVDGLFLSLVQAINLQVTGGSLSVRMTGVYGMRTAGAAAREILVAAAARGWEVDLREITTVNGTLVHEKSGKHAPYSDFAALAAQIQPSEYPKLKSESEFRYMGKSIPRLDIPAKTNGTAQFGIDIELPGLKYASIRKSPVFGNKLTGVIGEVAHGKVVELEDAVAVVADSWWEAEQQLKSLDLKWTRSTNDGTSQASIFTQFNDALDHAEISGEVSEDFVIGDMVQASNTTATTLSAQYQVPFLAHATMEPMNCTVWLHDGICEVWSGSQNPLGMRAEVANVVEMDDSQVIVHNQLLGGGFGRRVGNDYAIQAAQIARQINEPVKLIWSREEDIRQDQYRHAVVSRMKGSLNDKGKPLAWHSRFVGKHDPAEAPLIPYEIPNKNIAHVDSPVHVPFGVWRSVDHSHHGFFTESFMDELAAASQTDPYRFRANLLRAHPRHRAVLDLAADKANWNAPKAANQGRGIALVESFGTIVAQVVEATVNDGEFHIDRIVCAADPGFAFNPDGFKAQLESGIVYGLTAAIYGEISIEYGAVQQSNFHDYPMVRMRDVPDIETHIINSGGTVGGGGEPGTPPIAPALTNALFDASGTRIRELPLSKQHFKLS